jgi:hypothetical protein
MLTRLLAQHIHQQDPAVHIIPVVGWPLKEVRENGGWLSYLQYEKGWVQGEKTVFIFDDAQLSYEDIDLWGEFFVNIEAYDDLFAIAFASYGSPTSNLSSPTSSLSSPTSSPSIQVTPFFVCDSQRVTLRPIDHGDGLDPVGLLFSRMEFDELVSKQFSSPEHYFHSSFFDAVFDLTGGHVGAIHDFVRIIMVHDVRFFMMSEHIT